MAKISVSLSDLELAFDNSFYSFQHYLDLHTGAVEMVNRDTMWDLDELWVEIPEGVSPEDVEQLRPRLKAKIRNETDLENALAAIRVELGFGVRYIEIPPQDSQAGYQDMEEFIDTLGNTHLADLLSVAIRGKGAFRRFKDVLYDHPTQRQMWFDFENTRKRARMIEWLEELEVEFEVTE